MDIFDQIKYAKDEGYNNVEVEIPDLDVQHELSLKGYNLRFEEDILVISWDS